MNTNNEAKFIREELTQTPPKGCPFKSGDIVTFTNDYGVKFKDQKIIGFAKEPLFDKYIHLSGEAFWFPSPDDQLKLQEPT